MSSHGHSKLGNGVGNGLPSWRCWNASAGRVGWCKSYRTSHYRGLLPRDRCATRGLRRLLSLRAWESTAAVECPTRVEIHCRFLLAFSPDVDSGIQQAAGEPFCIPPDGGVSALAVLAVVYVIAHLPYGWLTNFANGVLFLFSSEISERKIRFSIACGLCSFACMVFLFWTPMRNYILLNWVGIDSDLAERYMWPLIIFFPLAVCIRLYLNGIALVQRRTQSTHSSAPARVGAILMRS